MKDKENQAAALRNRAEESAGVRAAPSSESPQASWPEEARQMLHELRVHQIELEQQVRKRTAALIKANHRLSAQIEEHKRIEASLQVERNKLRTILESIPEGVYIVNPHYDIEYTNTVIEKEFGPVAGRKCYTYLHDRMEICPWCKLEQVLSGKSVGREWHSEKSGKTYAFFGTPILHAPESVFKLGMFNDITQRKQAEKAAREYEGQLRNLSFRLLTAQETERSRIARELHDELGGALGVLKLRISFIGKGLQPDQNALEEECKQTLHYIDDIIDNVHRLSRDLSPSILADIGLTPALRWQIDNFVRHYGVEATTEIIDIDQFIPKEGHIMIYRTIQEALTNIGKHAIAEHIEVKIRKVDDTISFLIEDDGKGFDVMKTSAETPTRKGLGLPSMMERARMMGGLLQLRSEKGKGTRIHLSIPAAREENH